jgi:hypothetical protein
MSQFQPKTLSAKFGAESAYTREAVAMVESLTATLSAPRLRALNDTMRVELPKYFRVANSDVFEQIYSLSDTATIVVGEQSSLGVAVVKIAGVIQLDQQLPHWRESLTPIVEDIKLESDNRFQSFAICTVFL